MDYLKAIVKVVLILLVIQGYVPVSKASVQSKEIKKKNREQVEEVQKKTDEALQKWRDTLQEPGNYLEQVKKEYDELRRGVLEAEASLEARQDSIKSKKLAEKRTLYKYCATLADSFAILYGGYADSCALKDSTFEIWWRLPTWDRSKDAKAWAYFILFGLFQLETAATYRTTYNITYAATPEATKKVFAKYPTIRQIGVIVYDIEEQRDTYGNLLETQKIPLVKVAMRKETVEKINWEYIYAKGYTPGGLILHCGPSSILGQYGSFSFYRQMISWFEKVVDVKWYKDMYFGIEENVIINANGSGRITYKINSRPIMRKDFEETEFLKIKGEGVKKDVKNFYENLLFCHIESADFENLSGILLENKLIKVEIRKVGLLRKEATFEYTIFWKPDPSNAPFFVKHHFICTIELPGAIEKAYPLEIGKVAINPTVKKNEATWQVPLNVLLLDGKAIFKADFRSSVFKRLGFKSTIQSKLRETK